MKQICHYEDSKRSSILPNITLDINKELSLPQFITEKSQSLSPSHQTTQSQQEDYSIPPLIEKKPSKTLVLDLDETLVHSSFELPVEPPDLIVKVILI